MKFPAPLLASIGLGVSLGLNSASLPSHAQAAPPPQSSAPQNSAPQLETPPPAQEPTRPAAGAPANAPLSTTAVPVAEIIARVNDQIISKQDLDRAQQQMVQDAKQNNADSDLEGSQKDLLRDLIDQQLLLSKGKELGINGDTELIRRLDEIRKQNHFENMEDLEKAAQQQGVSFEDFKSNIRNSIITQQVVRDEVSRHLQVSPADEQAFFAQHKADFAQPESVHLSEILLPIAPDASPKEDAAALDRANEVARKIKSGSSFEDLAKAVSTGPTAQQGGDLGVFKRGQLAKELEDKTFALNTGQVTDPIRTKQGYILLKIADHNPGGAPAFKDVQPQVEEALYVEQMQPALRVYLSKLREQAYIDIKPGFVDSGSNGKETKPVFSAYAPPVAKSKRKKPQKQRFRDRSIMADKLPPIPKPVPPTPVPAGGPTEAAAAVAAAPAPPAPAVKTVSSTSKKKSARKVKVRYGQAPREAALPPATTPDAAAAAGTAPGNNGAPAASGDLASNSQAAAEPSPAMQAQLSPESQKMLGINPLEKQPKTRFSQSKTRPKTRNESVRAQEQAANKFTPGPAPAPVEKEAQAVNSAPLGLNGNTAAKKKPVRDPNAPKQRMADKGKAGDGSQPTDATATDAAAKTDDVADNAPHKRHKLLGVF